MGRNQHVLLVDPDVDRRAQVKQVLSGLAYAVTGEASYGIEASRLAAELQPDIALIHVEEPLSLACRTLEVVQSASPRTTPVVITTQRDIMTAQKVMLSGARGLVVSPAEPAALDSALRTARTRHLTMIEAVLHPPVGDTPPTAGFVVTVFGPKGGVGKTTLATNLAIALRRHSQAKVVVIDTDAYFGDVALTLGLQPDRTLPDLLEQANSGAIPDPKPYLAQHESGIWVLPARHAGGVHGPADPEAVAQVIRSLAHAFDFVVVDTPGTFGPSVAAALDESTTALLVTSADMASVKDARISLDALRDEGFDDDRLKVVVNHATNANSVTDADIARTVQADIFCSIPHDREVPLSTQRGKPLMLHAPRAKMALQVNALAALLAGTPAVESSSGSGGLVSLFRRRA